MAELNNTGTGQWSETDASNTSASPDGWPTGTYPNQVEANMRALMGSVKRFWDRSNTTVTTTGASGTYVYTPANSSYPTAYVNGETYSFKAHQTSAGADTLNINSLGAKNIYKWKTTGVAALVAGDIQNGQYVTVEYDSTLNTGAGGFQLLNTATAAAPGITRSARTTNTILAGADVGSLIDTTTAYNQTITAPGTLGSGWWVDFKNSSAGISQLSPASGNIDGRPSIYVYPGESFQVVCDGSNFYTVGRLRSGSLIMIQSQAFSAVASVSFTNGFTDTEFDSLVFEGYGITIATNTNQLGIRLNYGSGFAANGTSYSFTCLTQVSTSAATNIGGTTTAIILNQTIPNTSTNNSSFRLDIPAFADATRYHGASGVYYEEGNGTTANMVSLVSGTLNDSQAALTGVQLVGITTNISGTCRLYGRRS